ncbi:MAG: aminotransferase class V-fold PLP-dependent enzyme, partial [Dehalococcoidia bacterium]|nr:aminotransferase class V-fold PLP-dependent enzyme [Dehalococcoidia bacterium]
MTDLSPRALAWVRSQFANTQDFIYLNSGYTGPSPRSAAASVRAWIRGWYNKGLTTRQALEEEEQITEKVRRQIAVLLGCSAEEVTLTDNTSRGIALVAGGLDWKAGDEVVTNELEHPSGLLPWFLLRERWGVRVKVVSFPPGSDPLERIAQAITARTRLVCVSHVTYCTGILVPAGEVVRLAHQAGALCLVDGAQAAGNMPLDMGNLGCDFYALPGHKWLLGPPGTGALYVRRDLQDQVWPSNVGWNSVETFEMDGRFALWPAARRFEGATQPYSLLAGLAACLSFAESLERETIYGRISHLVAYLRSRLQEVSGVRLMDVGPLGPSALVCFTLEGWQPQDVVDRLLEGWRIVCRCIAAPPGIRVCPHFFNTHEELDI